MKTAPLGDIAKIVSGATPKTGVAEYWDGDVQWATPADLSKLNGPYISETPRKLTAIGVRSCATTVLPAGSVLLSSRAPIGHVAINTVPMATNQGFKSFVPGPDLDAKYLYHWLKSKTGYLQSLGNGATFKELSKKTTEQIAVPLPPLPEQRRIAAILDHADALRAKRRQILTHLDALAQSTFHDMFASDEGWASAPISELGQVTTGKTPPTGADGMFGGPIPFVTPGDLGSRHPVVRSVTEAGAAASRVVRTGSTLVCCIGATIGKIGAATEPSAFNQQINAVEWGDQVDDAYGFAALRKLKSLIVARGASTTLPLLPKGQFVKIEVPVPPIDLQRAFAERVRAMAAQHKLTVTASDSDEALFASLQSRAFRGEL